LYYLQLWKIPDFRSLFLGIDPCRRSIIITERKGFDQIIATARGKEVATMKAMTTRTMMPLRRVGAAMKTMMGKKLRMTPNHNVHVITHHGKLMIGRKGRKG
jgi:hypothetical protein